MWRMARDSQVLDLNASYAYLLWARDFAATSVVAVDTRSDEPCGFVTGYVRPDRPDTLMIWQVAVDEAARGRGIARAMLEDLFDRDPHVTVMETTITEDNAASIALFGAVAAGRGLAFERSPLFAASAFPDGHDAELLFRLSPTPAGTDPTS